MELGGDVDGDFSDVLLPAGEGGGELLDFCVGADGGGAGGVYEDAGGEGGGGIGKGLLEGGDDFLHGGVAADGHDDEVVFVVVVHGGWSILMGVCQKARI